jgi:cytidyltransferase-like protein
MDNKKNKLQILAVYPGRFQPFHKGHAEAYKWLKDKFGKAVIATTDKTELPKSPFNFEEKKVMMTHAGVPESDIHKVTNPYISREILKEYDPKKTVLVFAVSEKDMAEDPRFAFKPTKSGKPGYLQPYEGNENKLKPFGDPDKPTGYVVVTPTFKFNVLGKPIKSATELRQQFANADRNTQKQIITDLYGSYSKKVHDLMAKGIKKPKSIKEMRTLYEEIKHDDFKPVLDQFVKFAADQIGLKDIPPIHYKKGVDKDLITSFGGYDPESESIVVSTKDRHPMDIFRTLAHELVHHKQKEEGRVSSATSAKDGDTGSDIENEANMKAGIIMRHFGRKFPEMFKLDYVAESTNSAGGGVRGMGYVSGMPSLGENPEGFVSNYLTTNIGETDKMKSTQASFHKHNHNRPAEKPLVSAHGNWPHHRANHSYVFDTLEKENTWLQQRTSFEHRFNASRHLGKNGRDVHDEEQFMSEEALNEGIYDQAKMKAVFLAGGPGSGKDFVMSKSLRGHGLKEINSDTAFEYLMGKHGLDFEMPENERLEREILRGRAKTMTKEKERHALRGRNGLIINNTADDIDGVSALKKMLEDEGYDTHMVFVNTSNDVSRQRNVERGKLGNRKIPDGTDKQGRPDGSADIRGTKWKAAQANIPGLQQLFGDNRFSIIDNTVDTRKASDEQKKQIEDNFKKLHKTIRGFVSAENQNPNYAKWIAAEAQRRGITYTPPRSFATVKQNLLKSTQQPTQQPVVVPPVPAIQHPQGDTLDQARKLGLNYYGFGRFGKKVEGQNKVLFVKNNEGKLMRKIQEEKSIDKDFAAYISKPENRFIGTDSLTNIYKNMTPGQEPGAKAPEKKKPVEEDAGLPKGAWDLGSVNDGLGPTFSLKASPALVTGFAQIGSALAEGFNESVKAWALKESTQRKFADKYGEQGPAKLYEACMRLNEKDNPSSGITTKKSFRKLREGFVKEGYYSGGDVAGTSLSGGVIGTGMLRPHMQDGMDEDSVMDMMPKGYLDKFPSVKKGTDQAAQYVRERRRKQQTSQNYQPHKLVGPTAGKEPRSKGFR